MVGYHLRIFYLMDGICIFKILKKIKFSNIIGKNHPEKIFFSQLTWSPMARIQIFQN